MQKCLAFNHALTIHPGKNVAPCCVYNGKERLLYTDDWKTKFQEQGIKSEAGFLPECSDCAWEDKERGESWKDHLNKKLKGAEGIVYWDMKFNNTCNLQCRMCNPAASSIWEQKITPEFTSDWYRKEKTGWHKDIDIIYENLKDAKYLKFTGGEPFLIPQVWKVLDYCIENGLERGIKLEFTTNGTQIVQLEKLKKFKNVEILVSIDAIGDRFEYIRPGASWEVVMTNTLKLAQHFDVAITALPMIFNKDHMHEVKEFGLEHELEVRMSPPLTEPKWARPDALDTCPEEFYKYANLLDKQHNTNYKDFI